MIGLMLMAKDLALARAEAALQYDGWYKDELKMGWKVHSRAHGKYFRFSPTAHYYSIIDAISARRKP